MKLEIAAALSKAEDEASEVTEETAEVAEETAEVAEGEY